jgi:ribosomal protein S4
MRGHPITVAAAPVRRARRKGVDLGLKGERAAAVLREPRREEIAVPIDTQRIVELYSR